MLAAGAAVAGLLAARPKIVLLPQWSDSYRGRKRSIPQPAIVSRDEWGALPVDVTARNENGLYRKGSNPEGWYLYPADLRRELIRPSSFITASFYEAARIGDAAGDSTPAPGRSRLGGCRLSLLDRQGWHSFTRVAIWLLAARIRRDSIRAAPASACWVISDLCGASAGATGRGLSSCPAGWSRIASNRRTWPGHQQFNAATLCPGTLSWANSCRSWLRPLD